MFQGFSGEYWYLFYHPTRTIMLSDCKEVVEKVYKEIGRDYDEDYEVIQSTDFALRFLTDVD